MSVANDLNDALVRLDSETARLLEQMVRDALALAKCRSAKMSSGADSLGYPIGYFEATAGSFVNEPLDAPGELPMESRESW